MAVEPNLQESGDHDEPETSKDPLSVEDDTQRTEDLRESTPLEANAYRVGLKPFSKEARTLKTSIPRMKVAAQLHIARVIAYALIASPLVFWIMLVIAARCAPAVLESIQVGYDRWLMLVGPLAGAVFTVSELKQAQGQGVS